MKAAVTGPAGDGARSSRRRGRRRPDPVRALEAEASPALGTQAGRVRITSDVAAAVAGERGLIAFTPPPTAR